MNKLTKIYIAGHKGMVGSAIWRTLQSKGYSNLIGKNSNELDLRNQDAVNDFFNSEKPKVVIDAAAKQVLPGDEYALRVSALSLASQHLFESLQVWPEIIAQRARAYTHMDVRDQDSFGKIAFNSDELDLPH